MTDDLTYIRSVADALNMIEQAKHCASELHPITQVFYYPSLQETETVQKDFKLIDVDENFISRLEEGERFVFRGSGDEGVVLCTDDDTYEVKEGEISNALLCVPDVLFSTEMPKNNTSSHCVQEKKISAIMNSYLELRPTFPRLKKLRELLSSALYKGPDEDSGEEDGFYLCDLLNAVQCSRGELLTALRDMSACCIDNRWRLLDLEYETKVLSEIINLAEAKSWSHIPKTECCRIMEPIAPYSVLNNLFDCFTQPLDSENDDVRVWNSHKLCRSFGESLLRACVSNFKYNEFIATWIEYLPKGIKPDLSSLRGLALIENGSVSLFPEYDLPENIQERFRLLFQRKEKWTLQEIEPYIEKMASKGMNISVMLTKFSRPSTLNGVRVFGAKHIK